MIPSDCLSHLKDNSGATIMKIYRPNGRCNVSGIYIRQCREALQLSQEQLAARLQLAGLGLTQRTISRIETGDRIVPDYELEYFAKALETSVYHLLNIAT